MVKVCFAIFSYQSKILICNENRLGYQDQWEFPGGKVERDETIYQALVREIKEEIAIDLKQFFSLGHYYTRSKLHQKIQVFPFHQELNHNQFQSIKPKINQQIKFVNQKEILQYPFLKGSYGALYRYLLPDLYMITPEPEDDLSSLIENWQQQISKGIRLIQLRAKKIGQSSRLELARKLKEIMDLRGGYVLINSDLEVAKKLKIGFHLPSTDLLKLKQRPISKQFLFSTSCHCQQEITMAKKYSDIALISPIKENSYCNNKTSQLISEEKIKSYSDTNLVTYALSGMEKTDVAWVQSLGCQGVAGIRTFKELEN